MQPQKYCTIYIVRHGETDLNAKHLQQGQSDYPLNPKGEQQVKELAEGLKDLHFDAIFSSDLIRAKQSAEIINIERKLVINTHKLLTERNYGSFEGRPEKFNQEQKRLLFEEQKIITEQQKRNFKVDTEYESEQELASRMILALREIACAYLGQIVLVVNHGALMRSLLMHLGFGSYDELQVGSIENSGWIKLESDGVDFFVKETKGVNKIKV